MTGELATVIRPAAARDAAAIAALHTASWRAHYRGSFSDAYLDGPIADERLAFWQQRLDHARSGQAVFVAEHEGEPVGFVCVLLDHDRDYGSLVDNLHVAVDCKGHGLGRRLMGAAGEAMLHAVPRRPAYLFVLEANKAAQHFYDRVGGRVAERLIQTERDGSELPVLRYVWFSPAALVAGAMPQPEVSDRSA